MSSNDASIHRVGQLIGVRDEPQPADVRQRNTLDQSLITKYKMTLVFIAVAVLSIVIATVTLNHVVGNLTEDNLIRIAEENTSRDATHLVSMMRTMGMIGGAGMTHGMASGADEMPGMQQSMSSSTEAANGPEMQQPAPSSLESLAGPDSLAGHYRQLAEGLNIVKFVLFDARGDAVWSTDTASLDTAKLDGIDSIYWDTTDVTKSSIFKSDEMVTDLDGADRRLDIVKAYLPLRNTPEGPAIGTLEIHRDVSGDLATQVKDAKGAIFSTTVTTMGALFLSLLGFVVVADVTIGRSRRREQLVSEELAIEVQERATANKELQRTATALQFANKELESFSYSVSHDLRAPLRSLDGFSQILLEDYETQIDETGRGYLQRIRSNSQRMAQLIDDILTLSRVSRREIVHEQVDLSSLAESTISELREREPERNITFKNSSGLGATGDLALLRAALENLLSNAWKYSGKREHATIEFGCTQENGKDVYFVRDNGAGFDMAYADKLFLPFHRLHTDDEFEGTGVGLATVHRVISRHGGSIWAESEVDHGATFYFTLN